MGKINGRETNENETKPKLKLSHANRNQLDGRKGKRPSIPSAFNVIVTPNFVSANNRARTRIDKGRASHRRAVTQVQEEEVVLRQFLEVKGTRRGRGEKGKQRSKCSIIIMTLKHKTSDLGNMEEGVADAHVNLSSITNRLFKPKNNTGQVLPSSKVFELKSSSSRGTKVGQCIVTGILLLFVIELMVILAMLTGPTLSMMDTGKDLT